MITGTPLDGFVTSLLAASADRALRGMLRRATVQTAIRDVVHEAIKDSVAEVGSHLREDKAVHVRNTLMEHDAGLDARTLRVKTEAELSKVLCAWMTELDRQIIDDGRGYLGLHNVEPKGLAETLTRRVCDGIRSNGRAGGVLNPLAEWLWRDRLDSQVGDIKREVSYLRQAIEPSPAPRSCGLPGGVTDFTGRQQPLAMLAERLAEHDPDGAVVVIHAIDGMPGVGKTELALRAAHEHKHRYPDGQYFIDLHGYTDGVAPISATAALEELLRQAGLPSPAIPADLASRQVRWQALMASQRALVLLDNALDADHVRLLLPRAAGCLVLITGRSALRGLPGARTLQLDPLPQEEAIELFIRVAGSDKPLDRQAVATAVDLVGRLPLAVRTVASQLEDGYSDFELAGDLARAKDSALLVAEAGPLGPDAKAAFDTSLQRLDLPYRRAFSILGVHPGPVIGVPQFAALAEIPAEEATIVLRTLSRWNLIALYTPVGHRRYQQHDLLRDFARQCAGTYVQGDERSAALERLTAWYSAAITLIDQLWDADDGATRPIVEGLDLDDAEEAKEWIRGEESNLLALAEHASGRAAVWSRYGYWLDHLHHFASATVLYASAARLYRETGNRAGEADVLLCLGRIARVGSEFATADDHLKTALDLYRRIGNQQGEADTLVELGRVGIQTSSYASADEHLMAALKLYRRAGNQQGEGDTLHDIGWLQEQAADMGLFGALLGGFDKAGVLLSHGREALGSPAAAEEFRKALAIARENADEDLEAAALAGLGHVALVAHDDQAAADHYRAALELYRRDGDSYSKFKEAGALDDMGDVARRFGYHEVACRRWREALAIYLEIDSPFAASTADLRRSRIEQFCPE